MEQFNPIGTLTDIAADHRKKHGKYSDVLKKERELLFSKTTPDVKPRRTGDALDSVPSANYFSQSAEQFRKRYVHGHRLSTDMELLHVFLCNQYNVESSDVKGKSRKIPFPIVRKYYAFFLYYYFSLKHTDIASIMNLERSTITTHISEAIDDLETYGLSRTRAYAVDKFLHQLSKRRKHNAV